MFSPAGIAKQRMVNQRLWGTPFKNIYQGVLSLGAMQSQEFPYARWSVVQRTKNATEAMVDKAFAEGKILRTHVLRPTWHFVAQEDIKWLLELTAPRVNAVSAHYYRLHDLDEVSFARTNELFASALKGGQQLERKEMRAVLEQAWLPVSHLKFSLILMRAELDGVICSGAPRGKQQTYALLEERASNAIRLSRDEALAELVRRYFTTRGPATLKDFSWWSGLTQADGRVGLEMAGANIESRVVDGRTYWYVPTRLPAMDEPRVDLVQVYDEIGMAYTESRDALFPEGVPRQNPAYYNSILLNGRLIGHWRRTIKGSPIKGGAVKGSSVEGSPIAGDQITGGAVTFETQLFRALTKPEAEALEAAQERYRLSLR